MSKYPTPWKLDQRDSDNYIRDANGQAVACDMSYYPWIQTDAMQLIVDAVNASAISLPAPVSEDAKAQSPTLTFGSGDFSCASCGLGMIEPCEHWKEALANVRNEPTPQAKPEPAPSPEDEDRKLAEVILLPYFDMLDALNPPFKVNRSAHLDKNANSIAAYRLRLVRETLEKAARLDLFECIGCGNGQCWGCEAKAEIRALGPSDGREGGKS